MGPNSGEIGGKSAVPAADIKDVCMGGLGDGDYCASVADVCEASGKEFGASIDILAMVFYIAVELIHCPPVGVSWKKIKTKRAIKVKSCRAKAMLVLFMVIFPGGFFVRGCC